ncbi:MAG: hypothetical protein H6683_10490 [Deltaproteobacteria bacterium]|nr:hypothetical protein [Deltaproteobacteria bacterium]
MRKIGRFAGSGLAAVLVFGVFLSLSFHEVWWGRSDAAWTPSITDQDAARLMNTAWAVLGDKDDASGSVATPDGVAAVVLAAFSKDQPESFPTMVGAPAGDDLRSTVASLASKLRSKSRSQRALPAGLSMHLVRRPSGLSVGYLARNGVTYQRGLHGLMTCGDGSCVALPGPVIHARGLSYASALKRLHKGGGAKIDDIDEGGGLHRFLDEGYTSTAPDAAPARLYRASTLIHDLDANAIREACRIGGDFLARIQRSNGRWYYEYNPETDKLEKRDYNILRHAGTTYSLYQLYRKIPDPKYVQAADAGIRYLKSKISADPRDEGRLYVEDHRQAKLGGSGLALMAFVEKHHAVGTTPEDERIMEGLARHCMLSQNPDGSFESYHDAPGLSYKSRRSIYYPGEAMVGLIRYHQIHPERKDILEVVQKAADYLVGERWRMLGVEWNVPPDAWLALALEELHQVSPKPEYADYAFKIAEGMLSDQWIDVYPQRDYHGGYFPAPPAVTPAGSRSEGITAAWLVAQRIGDKERMTRLADGIKRAARYQIGCMIRPEFVHLYPNPERALGVFRHNPLRSFTRIDYNQHNISGLLVAADILEVVDSL